MGTFLARSAAAGRSSLTGLYFSVATQRQSYVFANGLRVALTCTECLGAVNASDDRHCMR